MYSSTTCRAKTRPAQPLSPKPNIEQTHAPLPSPKRFVRKPKKTPLRQIKITIEPCTAARPKFDFKSPILDSYDALLAKIMFADEEDVFEHPLVAA